jgi:hypothetical protein
MQKIDFAKNLLEYSKGENFSFLSADQHLDDPKRLSGGKQAFAAALAGIGGGIIWASGVGYSAAKKGELINDMQRMSEYCDLIGIKLDTGPAIVRMIVDGDEITGESLVGRFAMISERGLTLRKYSFVIMRNWIYGDRTSGTFLQVVTVFSSHKKAREFIQTYAEKCLHKTLGMFKNRGGGLLATYPWVVDLEDEEVTPVGTKWLGVLPQTGMFSDKYKTEFFRKRAI